MEIPTLTPKASTAALEHLYGNNSKELGEIPVRGWCLGGRFPYFPSLFWCFPQAHIQPELSYSPIQLHWLWDELCHGQEPALG